MLGKGAVSGQIDDEGRECMKACISRSQKVHERIYSSPQGEMLAAVWAVKIFHTYLHGQQFTLVTDHQPLTYMMTKNWWAYLCVGQLSYNSTPSQLSTDRESSTKMRMACPGSRRSHQWIHWVLGCMMITCMLPSEPSSGNFKQCKQW